MKFTTQLTHIINIILKHFGYNVLDKDIKTLAKIMENRYYNDFKDDKELMNIINMYEIDNWDIINNEILSDLDDYVNEMTSTYNFRRFK